MRNIQNDITLKKQKARLIFNYIDDKQVIVNTFFRFRFRFRFR